MSHKLYKNLGVHMRKTVCCNKSVNQYYFFHCCTSQILVKALIFARLEARKPRVAHFPLPETSRRVLTPTHLYNDWLTRDSFFHITKRPTRPHLWLRLGLSGATHLRPIQLYDTHSNFTLTFMSIKMRPNLRRSTARKLTGLNRIFFLSVA